MQSYDPDPAASQRVVAKTVDGGKTWSEVALIDDAKVREFGIAFIDTKGGWVGAVPNGFKTEDGGATWSKVEFGNAVNKIRVVRDGDQLRLHAIGVSVASMSMPVQKVSGSDVTK